MDRIKCRNLQDEVLAAVQRVCEIHKATVSPGRGTFDATTFTMKLQFTDHAADGTERTKAAVDWDKYHRLFNLPADGVGKPFVSRGTKFLIEGLKPSARRFPVLGKRVSDGKMFKFPAATVLAAMR